MRGAINGHIIATNQLSGLLLSIKIAKDNCSALREFYDTSDT